MQEILSGVNSLLKEANQLKEILAKRFLQVENDIDKIEDEETKEFLKKSLSLAKENKLNITDFITNIEKKCQPKS